MSIRDCEIYTLEGDGSRLAPSWASMQDELGPIHTATFCEFNAAEEVIGLLCFRGEGHFKFHVGIGESLRPYDTLYDGTDEAKAEERFWQAVTLHVRNM